MSVELYERAIQPIVDLDSDVIVYVPGYANMGPGEPTLVNASTFTSVFGDAPYKFVKSQEPTIAKNMAYATNPEKSWLYAKGLVDAGLTVLYHRCNPSDVGYAESASGEALRVSAATTPNNYTSPTGFDTNIYNAGVPNIFAKAKYFGSYYKDIKVSFEAKGYGLTEVTVKKGATTLETAKISFDPTSQLYVGDVSFTYIELFVKIKVSDNPVTYAEAPFDALDLSAWYAATQNAGKALYLNTASNAELTRALTDSPEQEFTVKGFEELLAGDNSPIKQLEDTDLYESVTYITTGGYYQGDSSTGTIASVATKVAMDIKSMALVDLDLTFTIASELGAARTSIVNYGISANASKGTTFYGADTFVIDGYKVVLPDSFGYLQKLASNIAKAIPPWIPVANNPQGVVSAIATTRPVGYAVKGEMITDEGISINPIIYKPSTGYTIMGNRTLFPTAGVPGPDSFLNCQLVVNTVARSARRAAQKLLIVSTNAQTAFSNWKSAVSKTCDKMLVNGDGLSSYNIVKLKKTQPATIDVQIELVVVEGLEKFKIYLSYALNME